MSELGRAATFKVVMAVWNSEDWIERAIKSVAAQTDGDYEVCVIVDKSDDDTAEIAATLTSIYGWDCVQCPTKRNTLENQMNAIWRLDSSNPDDVIVFVDGDDQLAHKDVFAHLRDYYSDGTKLTYGSYRSEPFSETCAPARPYPREVVANNDYRRYAAEGKGICFNHLRTFKYELFYGLNEQDYLHKGKFLETSPDSALMIPCMELARGALKFIPEELYIYNSENSLSDWRRHPRQVDADHNYILRHVPKKV